MRPGDTCPNAILRHSANIALGRCIVRCQQNYSSMLRRTCLTKALTVGNLAALGDTTK